MSESLLKDAISIVLIYPLVLMFIIGFLVYLSYDPQRNSERDKHNHDQDHDHGSDEPVNDTDATPISPVHSGKDNVGGCKFDRDEVRRTRFRPSPPIDTSNLPPPDPRVQALLASVSQQEVEAAMKVLTGETPVTLAGQTYQILSRNTYGKDIWVAISYLEDFYAKLGIRTTRHSYKRGGRELVNLIAEIPGSTNPNNLLILGSHLDSTAGWPSSAEKKAPGADDDASGTVALMQIAACLAKMPPSNTVRLCHFTGEEQGLFGSYVYSDFVAKEKRPVIAMIQMDMIGYCGRPGNRVDIHDEENRNGSHALVVAMIRNCIRYGLNLKPVDTHNFAVKNRSDHAGFLDHGYRAVAISEEFTDEGFNPNYHSTSDIVANCNLPYMVEVIRMVLVTVVELAECR